MSNGNHGSENLRRAVRLREEREERWRKEGERPLWQNLSMFGSLGWLIVIPALLGVVLGRWLDTRFDTGITFTITDDLKNMQQTAPGQIAVA